MLNLKDITISTKEAVLEYPAFPDFKVTVSYISRETAQNILKSSRKPVISNGVKISEETDEDKFSAEFVVNAIKGWKGLTIDIVSHMILINTDGIDVNTEVPFSVDNAAMLVKNCPAFSDFVNAAVYQVETFRN